MLNKFSLSLFYNEELIPLLIVEMAVILAGIFLYRYAGKKELDNKEEKWKIQDTVLCSVICLSFFIVGVWNLGSFHFPETYWIPEEKSDSVILQITDQSTASDRILILTGEADDPAGGEDFLLGLDGMQVEGSDDLEQWDEIAELQQGSYQQYTVLDGKYNYRYLRFTAGKKTNVIMEIGIKRAGFDEFLPLTVVSDSSQGSSWNVIDEQQYLTTDPLYTDQTYFDEIYHVRNAQEIAYGMPLYAFVHPLLGTQVIALFIRLLGNNPFAWRIGGVLISTAMIALMYECCRRLFGKRFYSATGAVFLAVDFMHLTTARIGTLEPYSVFFILLMTYFMIRYCQHDFYTEGLKKGLIFLMLSGISMGIGVSMKWTGAYAGVGLAVLFFSSLYGQYTRYKKAKQCTERDEIQQRRVEVFPRYFRITVLWCCIFFVAVPLLIYALSYLPCQIVRNQPWSIQGVIDQTLGMFDYHANLEATHPFQSVWWQWILDLRPIWYYYHETADAVYTISAMGHPLIWWTGFISIIYCGYDWLKNKSQTAGMILISYLAQLVPWLLVTRCVFIYHYYPSVPFLIIALVYGLKKLIDKDHRYKNRVRIFVLICILLFVLFLPAIAGFGTTHAYINGFLRWFESWYFG